ncbi:hypothetical protein ACKI1I_35230 [Streptomyces turgidiscabies]|uniref:Uncharacterized protein n=1 Tax=Streptomyces turgidiscabies (strain Car8) TaxID=698760 RepID=L7EXY2_STRT8|nr:MULTISPECIES: hypothetical protein [Streptomyces]ELP64273.1 hypothetical protein STRTUCAR8_04592 [Streptomyces turgidiscabies Car8]MDX3495732.1 hypothetical protein [Streptomyces turgidiscabies]GAQ75495.1 hypothetical protein T45_07280 [Streptomyces turgidiscabies]
MASEWDWKTGEGLLGLDDPEEWDAAFERGEDHLGTAVIGLAFQCSLEKASPRIARAMRLPDVGQRGFAFTAAGHAARLNGELTQELYAALRAEGPGGIAEHPIRDTLGYVPFRKLPWWFKRRWMLVTVRDKLEGWWLRSTGLVDDAWRALRRRS